MRKLRIMSILLCICIIITLVPAYAYAPTEAELNEAIMSGALDDVLPSYVIEQYAQESTLQSGFDFVIKVLSSYRI